MDRKKIDELMSTLATATLEFPWEDKGFYMEYLAQAYYYTSYSVRMLAAAAGKASLNQQEYHRRCVQHISEENGHDNIALTDFKRLGGNLDQYPELAVTRAFWEPQFAKIQENPVSLIGYILALEYKAVSTTAQIYQRVKKAHGEKCGVFLRVHAEDDPDHVDKAFAQFEKLSGQDKVAAFQNYEQSCRIYVLFLQEIAWKTQQRAAGKAA